MRRRVALLSFASITLSACGTSNQAGPSTTVATPPPEAVTAPPPPQIQLDITEVGRLLKRLGQLYTPTSDHTAIRIECEAIREYITNLSLQPRYRSPPIVPLAHYKAALALRYALASAASAAERTPTAVYTLSTNAPARQITNTRSLAHIPLEEATHYLNEAQKALDQP